MRVGLGLGDVEPGGSEGGSPRLEDAESSSRGGGLGLEDVKPGGGGEGGGSGVESAEPGGGEGGGPGLEDAEPSGGEVSGPRLEDVEPGGGEGGGPGLKDAELPRVGINGCGVLGLRLSQCACS